MGLLSRECYMGLLCRECYIQGSYVRNGAICRRLLSGMLPLHGVGFYAKNVTWCRGRTVQGILHANAGLLCGKYILHGVLRSGISYAAQGSSGSGRQTVNPVFPGHGSMASSYFPLENEWQGRFYLLVSPVKGLEQWQHPKVSHSSNCATQH